MDNTSYRRIDAGWVILPGLRCREGYSIIIDQRSIIDILPTSNASEVYPDCLVIDRRGCVLSPGFYNAHMHLYGVLAHGLEPPVPITGFESFLEDYWWPLVENQLDKRMLEAAAACSASILASSGVVALCDVLEAPNAGIEGLEVQASVLKELGLRAILSTEACQRSGEEVASKLLEANLQFSRSTATDRLIDGMMCTHTAFTCDETYLRKAVRIASEEGIGLQLHLNESQYEPRWCLEHHGMRTCSWYEKLGLLSQQLIAAQVVQVDAKEIALLKKHGVRCVHVPLSNCEVGGGISPVPDLLEAGLEVALGTDGYINDFFEVMSAAFLIHKGHREDPSVMAAREVYRMATETGADVMYPGREWGRLKAGNPADFITIDLGGLTSPVTEHNIFEQLVLYRRNTDVCDLFVDGRQIKKDHVLVNLQLEQSGSCVKEAQRLREAGRRIAAERRERG